MDEGQGIAQAAGCVAAPKSRSCSVSVNTEGQVYNVTEANNGMCALMSAFRFRRSPRLWHVQRERSEIP